MDQGIDRLSNEQIRSSCLAQLRNYHNKVDEPSARWQMRSVESQVVNLSILRKQFRHRPNEIDMATMGQKACATGFLCRTWVSLSTIGCRGHYRASWSYLPPFLRPLNSTYAHVRLQRKSGRGVVQMRSAARFSSGSVDGGILRR
jgi:hypothetical protein